MKLIVDLDPNDKNFYAIWINEDKAINCTLAEGIGSKQDANIILTALRKKYDKK